MPKINTIKKNIYNNIWCLLRPKYENGIIANLGICGTGFFITPNVFLTCYHLLNELSFTPNSEYNSTTIILKSTDGKEITINSSMVTYYEDRDITKVNISTDYDYLKITSNVSIGDNVENYGYPSDKVDSFINVESSNPLKFTLNKPNKQQGKLAGIIDECSIKSIDVNISDKMLYLIDYSSVTGFSGGPLLNESHEVVGIMSFIVPKSNNEYPNHSAAVSSDEFPD